MSEWSKILDPSSGNSNFKIVTSHLIHVDYLHWVGPLKGEYLGNAWRNHLQIHQLQCRVDSLHIIVQVGKGYIRNMQTAESLKKLNKLCQAYASMGMVNKKRCASCSVIAMLPQQ